MEKQVTKVYDVDFNRWVDEMQRARGMSIVQTTCKKIFWDLINFFQSSDIQQIKHFDGFLKKFIFQKDAIF